MVLGYEISDEATREKMPDDFQQLDHLLPSGTEIASKIFYAWTSPMFKVRKGQKHVFPGGLPLYHGSPGPITSLYLAVMESDQGARDLGQLLQNNNESLNSFADLAGNITAGASVAVVKDAFKFLIKGVETILLANKDDIRYTNVFTFKESDDWMAGVHTDWGNHRIEMTIEVEPPD